MKQRINNADIYQKRMLSEKEVQTYSGLGRTTCRKIFADMTIHIGKRILYDREKIDAYLNEKAGD